MKKIFVAGGAGFMGSHFIRHLLQTYPNYRVVNFDKLTYAGNLENLRDIEDNYPSRYRFIRGDIADPKAVFKAAPESDAMVNFAAETHVDRSIMNTSPFINTQIVGTQTLLEAVRKFEIKRYVQISTDEVYGSRLRGEFKETDNLNPSNPYAASKAAADLLVLSYWKTWKIPVIITRATNNFGPNQYPEKMIPLAATNIIESKKIPLYGKGNNIREWLYVLDHSFAVDCVLRKGKLGEIYNIGSGHRMTNKMLLKTILQILGKEAYWIENVTDRPGHDLRYALDSAKIRKLGWKPAFKFVNALRNTVVWYQQNELWWKRIKSGEYLKYYKEQYNKRQ